MTNARTAREWSTAGLGGDARSVARHFVAVSTNAAEVAQFGIDTANMFGFWDWVGGRYSMTSAIGLSTMIAVGPSRFREMLDGFHEMDEHFRTAPFDRNLPVLMGLLAIWCNEFFGAESVAVLPYEQYLRRSRVPQQLTWRATSRVSSRSDVDCKTAPITGANPRTNGTLGLPSSPGDAAVPAISSLRAGRSTRRPHQTYCRERGRSEEALAFARRRTTFRARRPTGVSVRIACSPNRPIEHDQCSPRDARRARKLVRARHKCLHAGRDLALDVGEWGRGRGWRRGWGEEGGGGGDDRSTGACQPAVRPCGSNAELEGKCQRPTHRNTSTNGCKAGTGASGGSHDVGT